MHPDLTRGVYERSVFLNCPFDAEYRPLLHAQVFAVQHCGFLARSAQEVEDGGEVRIGRIKRTIRECGYGIHDISRVELDGDRLPRFNMPLELGLFLGAQEYGDPEQNRKRSLVLDSEPFRYQRFCSDIAGQDVRAHFNDPGKVISAVRAMLATALHGVERIPGDAVIRKRYRLFRGELPALCQRLHIRPAELQFVELRSLIEEWIVNHPLPEAVPAPSEPIFSASPGNIPAA
jgi:hypothetical protein